MRRRDIFRETTIDTPFSTTMGAPKFLSRFRELMETKIGITIDMGGTEIGEATKSRGHKDPPGTRVYNKIGTASMQAKKQEHRVADRPRAKSSQSSPPSRLITSVHPSAQVRDCRAPGRAR